MELVDSELLFIQRACMIYLYSFIDMILYLSIFRKIKESYEAIAVRITDEGTLIVQKVDDENCEVELNGEEVSIRKLA